MKTLWIISLLMISSLQGLQAQEETLIYIGDPMCSWCYGFSPELESIHEALPDLELTVVLGGLRPNGTESMAKLGDFLQHHWEEVNAASGQPFSYDILKNEQFLYNTEPACRAVVTMKEMAPEQVLAFFHHLQTAFYYKNIDLTEPASMKAVVEDFGMDGQTFMKSFESDGMKEQTQADFALANEMGVRGFPSMLLKKGDEFHLISNGYEKAAVLKERIGKLLNK